MAADRLHRSDPIRLYIFSAHPVLRPALAAYLDGNLRCSLLGTAATWQEAVREIARLQPDLAVIESRALDQATVEVIRGIRQSAPATRLVGLALDVEPDGHPDPASVGLDAVVHTLYTSERLLPVIRRLFALAAM